MSIFDNPSFDDHEQVVFCQDQHSGLKAIIGIHNTTLGPAMGGCRMYPYASEEEALTDVLRLSKGMSYKAAITGLNLGGGKSVIIGDPHKLGSEHLFRALGRFVEGLKGRYITAEDSGTSVKYMEWVSYETKYVTGVPKYLGGTGDPSPVTAHGTFVGIKACLKKHTGSDDIAGIKVAVQGVGNVGYYLCKELHEHGARIFVTDTDKNALKRAEQDFNATVVDLNDIYKQDVDVFAPCALGGIINDKTIPQFKCPIIAGAANNQLLEDKHAADLLAKGILYAPDYAINAGGLVSVGSEITGGGQDYVMARTEEIYDTILNIFAVADRQKITTIQAANKIAEKRMHDVHTIQGIYC